MSISTEPVSKGPKTFGICQGVVLIMSGKRIRHPGLKSSVYFRLDCRSGGAGFDFDVKRIMKTGHQSFNVDYFGKNFPTDGWELCEDEESKRFEYKTESGHQPLLTRISSK